MQKHLLPSSDPVAQAITDHLRDTLSEDTTIDAPHQPHGTMGIDVRGDDERGQVVIEVGGRRFVFELWEIL